MSQLWRIKAFRLLISKGYYTVKYGYRLFMYTFVDLSHVQVDGDLLSYWKLQVPPKVKVLFGGVVGT